jgi:hypothetical protein
MLSGMCAILAPLVNSYKRLVQGFEAPVSQLGSDKQLGFNPPRLSRRVHAWNCAAQIRAAIHTWLLP